jgi:hypothetical protein
MGECGVRLSAVDDGFFDLPVEIAFVFGNPVAPACEDRADFVEGQLLLLARRVPAQIPGILDKRCRVAECRETACHGAEAGVFLPLEEWRIRGHEAIERAQALEALACIVDRFMHAFGLDLQHRDRAFDLFPSDGAEVLCKGALRMEGKGHVCASSSPSVASA